MDSDELKRRTFDFGVRVIRLCRALPKTVEARAVAAQLARAGPSVGANYRATCKARSRLEFVARIGVVEEEADESCYWLQMIIATEMLKAKVVQPLLDEGIELTSIFAQSRKTAGAKLKSLKR